MNIYEISDKSLLHIIGQGVQNRRLNKNMSQQHLADRAGTSRNSIQSLELGKGVKLLTLLQVLRALDSLETLDLFLASPDISPLQLAKLKGQRRQRASAHKDQS